MKMVITKYWEKVVSDSAAHYGTRVMKGEFERKPGATVYDNGGGWQSVEKFAEYASKRPNFWKREGDAFYFHLPTIFGIASYQVVEFTR